jgi:octaprenyl-diphosphate synthase
MPSFLKLAEADLEAVNRLIQDNLYSNVEFVEHVGDYLIRAGGKRLRPILSLMCARAIQDDPSDTIKLAAAVEFIHTATLLHDDVVDESLLRRGHETANAKWGNSASVLVGDFVYSRAFQMLVSIGNLEVLRILSETTNILAEGEVMQLINAGNTELDETEYFKVIRSKTAKLFEASCEGAAILSNATPEVRQALAVYGDQLGIAFQLVDDLLDYVGDADKMGKNVGDDLAEGKATLPLIHAMRVSSEKDAETIRTALLNKDTTAIDAVLELVNKSQALNYTQSVAEQHIERAKLALNVLDDSVYREALIEIADYCIARTQ